MNQLSRWSTPPAVSSAARRRTAMVSVVGILAFAAASPAVGASPASGSVAAPPVAPAASTATAPATATTNQAPPAVHPRVGDKAPAFVLKTIDKGEPRALDSLVRGSAARGAVVVFLSARCPYVVQARQPLAELVKQYGGKVAFVGVNANQNESVEDVKTDAAQNFAFPMLRDEGSKVADAFAAERTPEVFLVDAKGLIRYHGGVADLGPALADFTGGRSVTKAEAKAFGCTIKRKP